MSFNLKIINVMSFSAITVNFGFLVVINVIWILKYPKPLPWLPIDYHKYIFYDFKTKLDEKNEHIVNYAIAQYYNGDEVIFTNIDDFCNWAFTTAHKNYTFIAHYGQWYDA